MKHKKEKVQVIIDGRKVNGTRYLVRGELNSLHQVVEYRGHQLYDSSVYSKKSNQSAMLWGARRCLAELFEGSGVG